MSILFVTTQYIKDNTIVDNNVSDKIITPYIIVAQDLKIQPLLGTALWNDIRAQVVAYNNGNAPTTAFTNANYPDLLANYIKATTMWHAVAMGLRSFSFKISNKNVAQRNSDNSQSASMSDIDKLKEDFENQAQYYGERLTRHLRANPDKFPLYLQQNTNSLETIWPQKTGYTNGMYLGPAPRDQGERPRLSEVYQGQNGIWPDWYDENLDYYSY